MTFAGALRQIAARLGRGRPPEPATTPVAKAPPAPPITSSPDHLPIESPDSILRRPEMARLVKEISYTLDFTLEEFDILVRPSILRLAGLMHLLPASAAHHHRGPGGLLQHSLEVGQYAASMSDDIIFNWAGYAHDQQQERARWRVAACLSGLLHDSGKVLTEMQVFAVGRGDEWVPGRETIPEWGLRLGVSEYFIRWRSRVGDKGPWNVHEDMVSQFLGKIVSPALNKWLWEMGKGPPTTMAGVLSGRDRDSDIARLVLAADNLSCRRDRQKMGVNLGLLTPSVPLEQSIVEGMKTLLSDGTWRVNAPGARVWHLAHNGETALFVEWHRAAPQLSAWMHDVGVPNVTSPQMPADVLAEILADTGQLSVRVMPTGTHSLYWPVRPASPDMSGKPMQTVQMIRMANPDLLFTVLPPAIPGQFGQMPMRPGQSQMTSVTTGPVGDDPPADMDGPPADFLDGPPPEAYEDMPPADMGPDPEPKAPPVRTSENSTQQPVQGEAPRPKVAPPKAETPAVKTCPECGELALATDDGTGYVCSACGTIKSHLEILDAEVVAATITSESGGGSPKVPADAAARDGLKAGGQAGAFLLHLVDETAVGKRAVGKVLGYKKAEVWIYVSGLTHFKRWQRAPGEPDLTLGAVVGLLKEVGWLQPNPHYTDTWKQERDNQEVLVLTRKVSALVISALTETERRVAETQKKVQADIARATRATAADAPGPSHEMSPAPTTPVVADEKGGAPVADHPAKSEPIAGGQEADGKKPKPKPKVKPKRPQESAGKSSKPPPLARNDVASPAGNVGAKETTEGVQSLLEDFSAWAAGQGKSITDEGSPEMITFDDVKDFADRRARPVLDVVGVLSDAGLSSIKLVLLKAFSQWAIKNKKTFISDNGETRVSIGEVQEFCDLNGGGALKSLELMSDAGLRVRSGNYMIPTEVL